MRCASVLKILLSVFLLIVGASACFGQQKYILTDPSVEHRLDSHVDIFVDYSDQVTFDRVLGPDIQRRFEPCTENFTFGYLTASIWMRVRVSRADPSTSWVLEIPAPFLEYVDFYQRDSADAWHHSMSGYYRKHSAAEFSHTGHMVPLKFLDNESLVYVRIGGVSPKTFPMYAIEGARFREKNRWEDVGYGIFFGILAVMFFYNLFIYLILRQINYLYYFCTIVCTFLLFAAISGYGGKFLWPDIPAFNYYAGKLSLDFLVFFLTVFALRFLEVKKYSRVMYYVLWSLIPLSAIALVLVATNFFPFAGNTLVSVATLIFIATGIVVRMKGNAIADYFIAAWSIYFIGGLLISLRNSGILDYGFWTTHFVEIGAVAETTIIGLALGHQYRKFKREKEEAQAHALRIQEEAMAWLEAKVKERTEELSEAYEQLRATLATNEMQTQMIQQKNAELDSFFYRISHDLKGPISSALGLAMLGKLEVKDEHSLDVFRRLEIQLERMSSIFNGLVRLARLNNSALHAVKIDFDTMIDECIMSFHSHPNFRRITFKKDIQSDLLFYSEWTLLNGIIQNLIENSIKYAGAEAPYVHITVRGARKSVFLEVKDNGQGIPSEHLPRIFELFYRGTSNDSGTGLGLYILKRSVDRLNGIIDVDSREGVGSTFTIRLPSMEEVSEVTA